MNEASFDAIHRIGYATSSGVPQRFSKDGAAPRSSSSSRLMPRAAARPAVQGVSVEPGQTALTRMPCAASSHASTRVMARIAALVASYWPILDRPVSANAEDTITILPFRLLRRYGSAVRQQLARPVMLVCRIASQLSGVASAIVP